MDTERLAFIGLGGYSPFGCLCQIKAPQSVRDGSMGFLVPAFVPMLLILMFPLLVLLMMLVLVFTLLVFLVVLALLMTPEIVPCSTIGLFGSRSVPEIAYRCV
jgi:hypothetical protein